MDEDSIILRGVVGSTAFGLARPGSDIDRLGLYVIPSRQLHLVDRAYADRKETVVTKDPDVTMHEVAKYMRLALKCNPTMVDLLYLTEYEVETWAGQELVRMRRDFLSEPWVRSAYVGYAIGQIKRIKQEWANDNRQHRIAKHARHCFRLMEQAEQLLGTGTLTVKVKDPEFYWRFDEMSPFEIEDEFRTAAARLETAPSVLPEHPRTDRLQKLLWYIRGV